MLDVERFNYDPVGYMSSAEFMVFKCFCDYDNQAQALMALEQYGAIWFKHRDPEYRLWPELTRGAMLLCLEKQKRGCNSSIWVHNLNIILTELEKGWQDQCALLYSGFERLLIDILGDSGTSGSKHEKSLAWWMLYYHEMISLDVLQHRIKELNSTFIDDLCRFPSFKSSTARTLESYLSFNRIYLKDISTHIKMAGRLRVKGLI